MELRPGFRIARSFWLPIVLSGLVAAGIAYGVTYALSPTYAATTSLLVRGRDGRVLSSTGQSLSGQLAADASWAKALVQTYGTLIQSRPVAEQVVRELRLDKPRAQDPSTWKWLRSEAKRLYYVGFAYFKYGYYVEPPPYEGAVDSVQQNLTAAPIKDSMIVIVTANGDDPEQAAAIANSATRALITAISVRTRLSSQANREHLQSQVDAARRRVTDAESAVQQYKEQNGVTDIAEQTRTVLAGLDANRRDQAQADAVVADAHARVEALKASLANLDPEEQSTVRVRAGTGADTDSTGPSRVYQDLRRIVATAESDLAGLEAKRSGLDEARQELEARAAALPAFEASLNALRADVESARTTLRDAQIAYDSVSRGESPGAEEVSLIDSAVPPLYPIKPVRYIYALVGLVCGLTLAIAAAFLIDAARMDRFRQERLVVRVSAPLAVDSSRGVNAGTRRIRTGAKASAGYRSEYVRYRNGHAVGTHDDIDDRSATRRGESEAP